MDVGEEALTGERRPRVSVVVPVRDRRELLRRLLDALAEQTVTDHEVVVVDDHSTDGSADEARAEAARGRPVRVLSNPGWGAVSARLAGVEVASAGVLAFTDSDCVPTPGWLAAGLAAVDAGADVVQGVTVPARPTRPLERTVDSGDDGLYATCNVFYRRDAYDAAGGFDADAVDRLRFRLGPRARGLGFGEDVLLGWRVRRKGSAVFAPDAVVSHEVFPPDVRDTVSRAWMAGGFPALVREVPELRSTLLWRGIVLGHWSRLLVPVAAAAAVAGRPRVAAGALAGWTAVRGARLRRETGASAMAKVLATELVVDAVAEVALVAGSVRARTAVL